MECSTPRTLELVHYTLFRWFGNNSLPEEQFVLVMPMKRIRPIEGVRIQVAIFMPQLSMSEAFSWRWCYHCKMFTPEKIS